MADLQSLFLLWRGTKWQRARWRQVAAMTEPSSSRWSMAPGKAAPARGVCVTMLSRATSLHSLHPLTCAAASVSYRRRRAPIVAGVTCTYHQAA